MTAQNTKIAKTIGIIVGVIVVAIGVQWARFYTAAQKIELNQGLVLPANFFPFNGTFIKDNNGNIIKA